MKLLRKKSLILLIIGLVLYWINRIGYFIYKSQIDSEIFDQIASSTTKEIADFLQSAYTLFMLFGVIISVGLSMIFFFKAIIHRKHAKTGTYLTVLKVFDIIFMVFSILTLFLIIAVLYLGSLITDQPSSLSYDVVDLATTVVDLVIYVILLMGIEAQKRAPEVPAPPPINI